jgi:hypothetical protein
LCGASDGFVHDGCITTVSQHFSYIIFRTAPISLECVMP